MKKTLAVLFILMPLIGFSQFDVITATKPGEEPVSSSHSISIVPHYALFNSMRFDYEYVKGNKAYNIALIGYYQDRETHPTQIGEGVLYHMQGGGIGYNQKLMRTKGKGYYAYFAGGIIYSYIESDFLGYGWRTIEYNDTPVQIYDASMVKGYTNRVEANVTLGVQVDITKKLFGELYVGMGYRYSINNFVPLTPGIQIENPFDLPTQIGYTGIIFVSGIKLGFHF